MAGWGKWGCVYCMSRRGGGYFVEQGREVVDHHWGNRGALDGGCLMSYVGFKKCPCLLSLSFAI